MCIYLRGCVDSCFFTQFRNNKSKLYSLSVSVSLSPLSLSLSVSLSFFRSTLATQSRLGTLTTPPCLRFAPASPNGASWDEEPLLHYPSSHNGLFLIRPQCEKWQRPHDFSRSSHAMPPPSSSQQTQTSHHWALAPSAGSQQPYWDGGGPVGHSKWFQSPRVDDRSPAACDRLLQMTTVRQHACVHYGIRLASQFAIALHPVVVGRKVPLRAHFVQTAKSFAQFSTVVRCCLREMRLRERPRGLSSAVP
jgi:hypothetical protein